MNLTVIDGDTYELAGFSFDRSASRRRVVFDVESTGADPERDNVTQLGAVAVYDDGPRDGEYFRCLVKPGRPIPEKIERLTGVTNSAVAAADGFAKVWPAFVAFCGDAPLVTQCGYEFDFPLLDRECERVGLPGLTNERLDTKAIFARLHPARRENFSTNFLSDHYAIDRSPFQRHDALGDAKLIARIFQAQVDEMSARGIVRLEAGAPLRIRRFVLPPL